MTDEPATPAVEPVVEPVVPDPEPVVAPVAVTPAQPPVPDPSVTPAAQPAQTKSPYDPIRTAHVLSRQSPEAVNKTLDTMLKANPHLGEQLAAIQQKKIDEAAPPPETSEDANARIDKLEREIYVRDVILDLDLSKSDAQFLTGANKQDIYNQGTALKERIGATNPLPVEGGDKPPVTPTEILPVQPKPNERPPEHKPAVGDEPQTVAESMAALRQAQASGALNDIFPIPENINTNI